MPLITRPTDLEGSRLQKQLRYYGSMGGDITLDEFKTLADRGHNEVSLAGAVRLAETEGLKIGSSLKDYMSTGKMPEAAPAPFNPVNTDGALKQIQTFAGTGLGASTANPQYDATKFIKMGNKNGVTQYAHRTPENLAILDARVNPDHPFAQQAQDNFAAMTANAQLEIDAKAEEPKKPEFDFEKAFKDLAENSRLFQEQQSKNNALFLQTLQNSQKSSLAQMAADQQRRSTELAASQRTYQQNQARAGQLGALQIGGSSQTPRTGGTQGFKRRKLQINPVTSNALSGILGAGSTATTTNTLNV